MAIAEFPCPFAANTSFYAFYLHQKIAIRNDILFHSKLEINSFNIINSNGLQRITVPIKKIKSGSSIRCDEVLISYDIDWPKLLIKSLQSAYGKSPFFEYYEGDIRSIIDSRPERLMELNMSMHEFMMNEIRFNPGEFQPATDSIYENPHSNFGFKLNDLKYEQTFTPKFGFLQPVSVLDLIFNEGRAASLVLRKVHV